MSRAKGPFIGDELGTWTVQYRSRLRATLQCKVCWDVRVVSAARLRSKGAPTCLHRPDVGALALYHYRRLELKCRSVVRRCSDPSNPRYGGRGISCGWVDSTEMVEYLLGLDGWRDLGLSLDRIDNSVGYVQGNLRFATRSVQQRNQG